MGKDAFTLDIFYKISLEAMISRGAFTPDIFYKISMEAVIGKVHSHLT